MIQSNMTIGFFGDSFCSDIKNKHSIDYKYDTYLEKVANHFTATITNTGVGGSSAWDVVLIQFNEQVKKGLPDVCVFVWSDLHRLFHRTHRNLNFNSVERIHTPVHNAAKEYYHHLHDQEKQSLEYISLLYYFDNVILPKHPNINFIHLWSFGEDPISTTPAGERHYIYQWKTGVEIRPALATLSVDSIEMEFPTLDLRANHISGDEKNQKAADWIISAINYPQA